MTQLEGALHHANAVDPFLQFPVASNPKGRGHQRPPFKAYILNNSSWLSLLLGWYLATSTELNILLSWECTWHSSRYTKEGFLRNEWLYWPQTSFEYKLPDLKDQHILENACFHISRLEHMLEEDKPLQPYKYIKDQIDLKSDLYCCESRDQSLISPSYVGWKINLITLWYQLVIIPSSIYFN